MGFQSSVSFLFFYRVIIKKCSKNIIPNLHDKNQRDASFFIKDNKKIVILSAKCQQIVRGTKTAFIQMAIYINTITNHKYRYFRRSLFLFFLFFSKKVFFQQYISDRALSLFMNRIYPGCRWAILLIEQKKGGFFIFSLEDISGKI